MEFDESYKTVKLVYGDTDSLYSEWGSLLDTIEGIEDMTEEQKLDIVLKINQGFLDSHNYEYIKDYYKTRGADSVHEFELETVSATAVWLDVKKKYAKLLAYKDGKYFDKDHYHFETRGLEIAKSSTPSLARKMLTELITYFLKLNDENTIVQRLNIKMQEYWREWKTADVEVISGACKVNKYAQYLPEDTDYTQRIVFPKGCPFNVKGLANYNYLAIKYKTGDEPVFSGKVKIYDVKRSHYINEPYMCFMSKEWKPWMEKYAPIDRESMFKKYVLEPFNRVIMPSGYKQLFIDGHIELTLF